MIKKLNHHIKQRGLIGTLKRFNDCRDENGLSFTVKQIFKPLTVAGVQKQVMAAATPEIKLTKEQISERYLSDGDKQRSFLESYGKNPLRHRMTSLVSLLKSEKNIKGVVLYPVSYDITVKQRPEHILRVLAEEGYLCLMLKIGADHSRSHIQKMGKRLYYTDLYEESIAYFANKPVFLYSTTPFFYYLIRLLKKAFVIYDVLDDLKIFANYCPAMENDHYELLRRADAIIYSSKVMKDNLQKVNSHTILLENGVWSKDFEVLPNYKPKSDPTVLPQLRKTKVGYHGVVSELLNFDIIESLLQKSDADVYLIGPVTAFDQDKHEFLVKRVNELKKYRNLHLLGFVPYEKLSGYLKQFDYSIIPFNLTEATHAVSPLKLFESIAAGKPVIATATKTLLAYQEIINILEPEAFAGFVAERKGLRIDEDGYRAIVDQNSWPNLVEPLLAHIEKLRASDKQTAKVKSGLPTVDIININFYDWKGEVLYKGGAERYVYDLAKLCQELGYQARIMQHGNFYFTREYQGVPVIGVPSKFNHSLPKLSEYYNSYCDQTDLIIASPLDLACELNVNQNIIGINHGIYWDNKDCNLNSYSFDRYKDIFNAVKNVNTSVCVDTNFINWLRTYDWDLAQKCEFIPNYVDTEQFKPSKKNFDGDLTVLYPRRLYEARGLYITIDAFTYLLKKYPWLKLHLVGQADEKDTIETYRFINQFPKQVIWYELDMQDMHKAYERSHIALVPTMYAEGTSLSCIEAMATNNAVISTTIGGLPNIVKHRYNGILIKPAAEDLISSVERLIEDRDLLKKLASNALATVESFNKTNWMESWTTIIQQYMAPNNAHKVRKALVSATPL